MCVCVCVCARAVCVCVCLRKFLDFLGFAISVTGDESVEYMLSRVCLCVCVCVVCVFVL